MFMFGVLVDVLGTGTTETNTVKISVKVEVAFCRGEEVQHVLVVTLRQILDP